MKERNATTYQGGEGVRVVRLSAGRGQVCHCVMCTCLWEKKVVGWVLLIRRGRMRRSAKKRKERWAGPFLCRPSPIISAICSMTPLHAKIIQPFGFFLVAHPWMLLAFLRLSSFFSTFLSVYFLHPVHSPLLLHVDWRWCSCLKREWGERRRTRAGFRDEPWTIQKSLAHSFFSWTLDTFFLRREKWISLSST